MDGAFLSGFMLFAALFFVALNGVFVLAEFSFATIRATKVEGMVREGRAGAGIVREATRRLDAYLAVCQLDLRRDTLFRESGLQVLLRLAVARAAIEVQ